ncbi:hypothetical protein L2E82_28671 [Cichorium intybus]|uniref:Uncharacterized protein n=2 Tax=Cichorium intybus TaxID=13427 RepID=A0ACB9CWS6_CICIN|nr:hypothetical protein L2E82_28670 [Cichorium intybus]KAI3738628.1 hypothetical protein L2E82_28671 [Cichorium intybus]
MAFRKWSNLVNGGVDKPVRRLNGWRYNERLHCCHNRISSCYQHNDYRQRRKAGFPFRVSFVETSAITKRNTEDGRSKIVTGINGSLYTKKVWEPISNPDSDDVTDRICQRLLALH